MGTFKASYTFINRIATRREAFLIVNNCLFHLKPLVWNTIPLNSVKVPEALTVFRRENRFTVFGSPFRPRMQPDTVRLVDSCSVHTHTNYVTTLGKINQIRCFVASLSSRILLDIGKSLTENRFYWSDVWLLDSLSKSQSWL